MQQKSKVDTEPCLVEANYLIALPGFCKACLLQRSDTPSQQCRLLGYWDRV